MCDRLISFPRSYTDVGRSHFHFMSLPLFSFLNVNLCPHESKKIMYHRNSIYIIYKIFLSLVFLSKNWWYLRRVNKTRLCCAKMQIESQIVQLFPKRHVSLVCCSNLRRFHLFVQISHLCMEFVNSKGFTQNVL